MSSEGMIATSIARASSSPKAARQARSGDVSPCVGSNRRTLMSMPGAVCRRSARSGGRKTAETPSGAPIVLAAAGAGLAALEIAGTAPVAALGLAGSDTDKEVAELIQRSAESNAALMRGDIDRYRALITATEDFTLMSPFGGTPTRSSEVTTERLEAMGRFFRNGTLEQELIQSYGSADMVVLAITERARVEVGGLPAQNWPLRVTLVYRREASEWQLAHRHADPPGFSASARQTAARLVVAEC